MLGKALETLLKEIKAIIFLKILNLKNLHQGIRKINQDLCLIIFFEIILISLSSDI
jgi:hypothetical protein